MDRPLLSSDLSSGLPSLHSFGGLSRFLREGLADEESRELRDSIGALAMGIDAAVTGRREVIALHELLARIRVLMDHLRSHQRLITGLGTAWSPIYEYNAYVRAVQQLYDALVQWVHALQRRSPHETSRFETFDLVAWRTLGEGALLLDIYERGTDDRTDDAPTAVLHAAPQGDPSQRPPVRGDCRAWLAGRWQTLRDHLRL